MAVLDESCTNRLGRAFASDENWQWLEGMLIRVDGATHRLEKSTMWMADRPDAVPVLEDFATLGAIEHGLLPGLIRMPNASLWWSQGKWHYGCGATSWGSGKSKPLALLTALRNAKRGVARRG